MSRKVAEPEVAATGASAVTSATTPRRWRGRRWRRENPELAERQAELFHRLWDNPGGAVKKEKLLALELCR